MKVPVAKAKDSKSKTVFAHAVGAKESDEDGCAAPRLAEDIAWLSHTKVTLKSDNEPASVKVLKDPLRTAGVGVEEFGQVQEGPSVTYDSKSNGGVENAAKQVTKLLRMLKSRLGNRLGKKMPTSHPLTTRLVEHTARLFYTRVVGADGPAAYHRTKGNSYAKRSVGCGEYVMHMLPTKGLQHDALAKLDP